MRQMMVMVICVISQLGKLWLRGQLCLGSDTDPEVARFF